MLFPDYKKPGFIFPACEGGGRGRRGLRGWGSPKKPLNFPVILPKEMVGFVLLGQTGQIPGKEEYDRMAFFDWKPEYSVNIREIDQQHQKLVAMLNELHEAMAKGEGREALGPVLKELADYTRTHFANEERLLKRHGYPDYEVHKKKHEKMAAAVLQNVAKFDANESTNLIEVFQFLKDWLKKHIMHTDMAYSGFLNGKGVS
jgi:hemerythrin